CFDTSDNRIELLEMISSDCWTQDTELLEVFAQRAEQEKKDREETNRKRMEDERLQREQELRRLSNECYQKCLASKRDSTRQLAERWNECMETLKDKKEELQDNTEFINLYYGVMNAVSVPAKVRAYKAFYQWLDSRE